MAHTGGSQSLGDVREDGSPIRRIRHISLALSLRLRVIFRSRLSIMLFACGLLHCSGLDKKTFRLVITSDPEPDSDPVSSLDMKSKLRIFIASSFSWEESVVDRVQALRLFRNF